MKVRLFVYMSPNIVGRPMTSNLLENLVGSWDL
jgi:hypothetical protein